MNAVSPPPAGWYPDPSGRAPFRYWDGARWTEHTDQGTAPTPSATTAATPSATTASPPPPPAMQAPAQYGGGNPGYLQGTPSAPVSKPASQPTGATWTTETFMADVKKLDGFALVVVGALLFIVASFLPWTSGSISTDGSKNSESSNAWDGVGVWAIRGWEVNESNAVTLLGGGDVDSGTDMIVLLPIALIAVGAAAASRLGKRVSNVNEIVLGASGLLALLMLWEAVHVSGALDDITKLLDNQVFTAPDGSQVVLTASGSLSFGLYFAVIAALVMAGGAAKNFMAARASGG